MNIEGHDYYLVKLALAYAVHATNMSPPHDRKPVTTVEEMRRLLKTLAPEAEYNSLMDEARRHIEGQAGRIRTKIDHASRKPRTLAS